MINLKPIEQSNNYSCGTAALESLLDFYGIKQSQEDLEKLCDSSPEHGTSPEGLMKGINNFGLMPNEVSPFSWDEVETLIRNKTPVIVEWYSDFIEPGDGHYSVAFDINDKEIFLMDPEIGSTRIIEKSDFLRRWGHSEPAYWALYISR